MVKSITDPAFRKYARVVKGYDWSELAAAMEKTPCPDDQVIYVASSPELESISLFRDIQNDLYGGIPVEVGFCNGRNHLLNAVEYHRTSEFNYAATDTIFLFGCQQDVDPDSYSYDSGKMEAFFIPKGTMVETYATTLHYAPCSAAEKENFRVTVILPKFTNEALRFRPGKKGENALLFAQNKWLIAHPESGLEKDGAFIGITGKNLRV